MSKGVAGHDLVKGRTGSPRGMRTRNGDFADSKWLYLLHTLPGWALVSGARGEPARELPVLRTMVALGMAGPVHL